MALDMPTINDLPYHPDKLPRTTPEAVDALAAMMRFKMFHLTKKDEHTLAVLSGVILYQHLDQFQQRKVMEMIMDEDHIHKADWDELRVFCLDPKIQPKWWLWSLTTEELEALFKEQEQLKKLLATVGLGLTGMSLGAALKEIWKKKRFTLDSAIFLLTSTFVAVQNKQHSNTKEELERRQPDVKAGSSRFY